MENWKCLKELISTVCLKNKFTVIIPKESVLVMLLKNNENQNSQTMYNLIGTIIRTCIGFITMPVFTRMLGTEQYGKYSVYASWLSILVCVIGFKVESSIGTGYYHFKDNYNQFRKNIFIEGTVCGIAVIFWGIIFGGKISYFLEFPFVIFFLMLSESFAQFVISFASTAWLYEKKALYNLIVSVAVLVSTTALSIVLLIAMNESSFELYYARVLGAALPQIIIALIIWIIFFDSQRFKYKKEYWIYGLHFGIPIIFHTLSHQVLSQSDRVMMQKMMISDSEIGIYSFFYTFTSVLTAILGALNNSWCPFLYDLLDKKDYGKLKIRIKNYVQVFTVLACGFLLLSREVVKLFASSDYWSGMSIVPILVLVVYCTYIYQFAVNYEFYNAKPKIVAFGTAFSAIVNIVLNFILIPHYGMYGAAAATLLSYAALAIMHIIVVKTWRYERYPLNFVPIFIGLAAVMAVCLLYYFLAELVTVRWAIGAMLGIILIFKIKKRKTIF